MALLLLEVRASCASSFELAIPDDAPFFGFPRLKEGGAPDVPQIHIHCPDTRADATLNINVEMVVIPVTHRLDISCGKRRIGFAVLLDGDLPEFDQHLQDSLIPSRKSALESATSLEDRVDVH